MVNKAYRMDLRSTLILTLTLFINEFFDRFTLATVVLFYMFDTV